MARRYRYSFTRRRESGKGKGSIVLSILSAVLFVVAVGFTVFAPADYLFVAGGICLFAAFVSVYGFILGLIGFSEPDAAHNTCIAGAIANGVIMIFWLGMYLGGLR